MKMHKFCGCAGISSHLLSVSVLVASLCASAATNYVVPWYANPVATNVVYDALLVNDPADATIAAKITTAWATVSGADVLSGKTSLVKTMGDTTYFRPKFYVLSTDGDIVEFTMAKDLSSAVWTNALTAAKLATAASASGTASDLQVSDDGRLAFLNYGGIWKALGYKPPTWTLHVLDSNGEEVTDVTVAKRDYLKWVKEDGVTRQYVRNDIENGGSAYITDGTFQIGIYNYYGGVGLGTFGDSTANAFRGDGVSEFLDMSAGVCRFAGGNFSIRASTEYALGIPTGGRTARVILHSTRIESIRRIMGGWAGGYEEVVIDTASIPDTSLNNTRPEQYGDGFTPTVKRLVFNVPNLTLNQWGTFPYAPPKVGDVSPPITNAAIAAESRWEDFNFDNITWTSGAVLYNFDCGGILSLPVVTNVGSQAFAWNTAVTHESTTPVEVRLSPKNKTLRIIGKQAFYGQTNIWRVVIGGHDDGVLFAGADATYPQHFAGMKLKEVEFTGGLPMFEANMGNWVFNNPSGAKSFVFVVPREARWTSFLEGSFRPANDNEIRDYMAANPGRYVPFGVITNNTLLHTTDNQFVAYADSFGNGAPFTFAPEFNSERGSVSMTVIGGNQPDGLGRYEPGTIVRFTATPAAGFTFRKWYGDTGTNDATSASIDIPIEKGTWIHARFTGGWTITGYDSAAKTAKATDGNFKINLSAMDASKHTFTLCDPNQTIGGLFDIEYTDNGDGTVTTNMMANSSILDLGGEFHLEGDATPWRATAFANVSSVGVFPIAYLNVVNTFISPGTITSGLKRDRKSVV